MNFLEFSELKCFFFSFAFLFLLKLNLIKKYTSLKLTFFLFACLSVCLSVCLCLFLQRRQFGSNRHETWHGHSLGPWKRHGYIRLRFAAWALRKAAENWECESTKNASAKRKSRGSIATISLRFCGGVKRNHWVNVRGCISF